MDLKQKIISLLVSVIIFVIIIELVRRKKLIEEFSWIWLLAGISIVAVAIWGNLFAVISRITGIISPTSIVFFFGIIFLILINLQISIRVSKNRDEIKNIVQQISLCEHEIEALKTKINELNTK